MSTLVQNMPAYLTVLLALLGIALTWWFSHHRKKLARDQMQKELFREFNERYDLLNDKLYTIKVECKTLEDLDANPELKYALNDFFNLCAEEYFWYSKKRLDKEIWRSWHMGMNYWYNHVPVIQDAWVRELEESGEVAFYLKNGKQFFTKA